MKLKYQFGLTTDERQLLVEGLEELLVYYKNMATPEFARSLPEAYPLVIEHIKSIETLKTKISQ